MPGPYSLDLRKRVVDAYLSGEETYEEVGERFSVGEATVDRWVSLYRRTGSVVPRPMGGSRNGKFDEASEQLLEQLVAADPGATRVELVAQLRETGLNVSPSAVQRALARRQLTRKKRRSTLRNATPSG